MASWTSIARDAAPDDRFSVASELEAIFAPLPRLEPAVDAPASSRRPTSRSGTPRAWILYLVIVALAALAISLVYLRPIARDAPERDAAKMVTPAAPIAPPAKIAASIPAAAPPVPTPPRSVVPRAPRKKAPAPRRARCPRSASQAWCLHGTITATDTQLRNSYNAAVRAGVDRDTLVDIRRDWKRLRGRANRDPRALIRGYALLSQQLRAEIRRRHR